jgi:hypothetical protein
VAVGSKVHVDGMPELRRALREVEEPELRDEVKRAFRDAAGVVADEAKMRANFFSFRLADTIRPGSTVARGRPAAFVKGGKAALPWYGWADFGSRRPKRGQARSVGPWANSGPGPREGRFIYPAIRDKAPQVHETIEDGVRKALRNAGLL